MKTLAVVLVLLCTGCVGQYLPEVSIPHSKLEQLSVAVTNSCEAADLNGDGVTEGRAESTAFWNNTLAVVMVFATPDATTPER